MASFNILGSCVCRDLFGYQENCEHVVVRFLQSTSPLTWFYFKSKPQKELCMEDLEKIPKLKNFQKRCVSRNYNHTVLDYYDVHADYFIVNLVSLVNSNLGMFKLEDGTRHYFTMSSWFHTLYENGLRQLLGAEPEVVNRYEYLSDRLIQETTENFIKWLTLDQGYAPDHIILITN